MTELCLAPWTHTYMSPQSERRLCCASREPSQSFKQYIDKQVDSSKLSKEEAMDLLRNRNVYNPVTLEEHWNSEHMKDVRRRMMSGEEIPECEVCNKKLLNVSVYRDYWNTLFAGKREELMRQTDPDGTHRGLPISFDYRLKNTCTFKCRMCGPMLSSAWEAEARRFNPDIEKHEQWMQKGNRLAIRKFQEGQASDELWDAIRSGRIEEIYWVGGEPTEWQEHWDMMEYMVKNGIAQNVYVRYNTNLRRLTDGDRDLTKMLPLFKDWQVCASLDATGKIGEYIRTGLDYLSWVENMKKLREIVVHPRQLKIDLTITLPAFASGELKNMALLADNLDVELLTKVTFAFTPDVLMSPMCLPRPLLEMILDDLLATPYIGTNQHSTLIDVLIHMRTRPTFQEEFKEGYIMGLWQGKQRLLDLEKRRDASTGMSEILSYYPKVKEWWDAI